MIVINQDIVKVLLYKVNIDQQWNSSVRDADYEPTV